MKKCRINTKLFIIISILSLTYEKNSTVYVVGTQKSFEVGIKIPTNSFQSSLKFIGKVCYHCQIIAVFKECLIKYENYNKHWIILVENDMLLFDLVNLEPEFLYKDKYQILVNNDTVNSEAIFLGNKPIFLAPSSVFDEIKDYNIDNEKENTHIGVKCTFYGLNNRQ